MPPAEIRFEIFVQPGIAIQLSTLAEVKYIQLTKVQPHFTMYLGGML